MPTSDEEWLWVSHDGELLARGREDLVVAERDAYERGCREHHIVPAVTFLVPAASDSPI